MIVRPQIIVLAAAACMAAPMPVAAAGRGVPIHIEAGPLGPALRAFAKAAGVELLFSETLVTGKRAPRLHGRLTPEAGFDRLLSGSRLSVRRLSSGAFVIFAVTDAQPAEEAVPEILVIGTRTQNADIRRTAGDVQPYKVYSGREVREAHRDNLEQFFQARESSNTLNVAPARDYALAGHTRSAVNLRGLGEERSLVLVDGRRLPGGPTEFRDMLQPDVNAIPLSAIDRIETLTGTAGGIYGPDALGGVINVVLKRDYNGAGLHTISGISSRADAASLGLEGHIGFSPNGGRTSIMLAGGYRAFDALREGDRDFRLRQRQRFYRNAPAEYIQNPYGHAPPASNAVLVVARSGDLALDPAFGGASLGAPNSYLPLGFSGTLPEAVEILKQNAGQVVLEPAPDKDGAGRYLASDPTYSSALMSVRHQLADDIEVYLDAFWLRNRGYLEAGDGSGPNLTLAQAATNPFVNNVYFVFPRPEQETTVKRTQVTARATAGVLFNLPRGWRGSADVSVGRASVAEIFHFTRPSWHTSLQIGRPFGGPLVNPLGNWSDLLGAVAAHSKPITSRRRLRNEMLDASLRLGGPLVRLPGGRLTGTLLLQRRREKVPAAQLMRQDEGSAAEPIRDYPERRQSVDSIYAEVRAPLGPGGATFFLLRGLEFQLALRGDRKIINLPGPYGFGSGVQIAPRSERTSLTYVAGLTASPVDALRIRASIATGEQSLPVLAHFSRNMLLLAYSEVLDPLRGDERLPTTVTLRYHGTPDFRPERARTLSLGAILTPWGAAGPRLSIDYSNVRQRNEPFLLGADVFVSYDRAVALARHALVRETIDPRRVTRAPLTEADRARGFTAGAITAIDTRGVGSWTSVNQSLDLAFDWHVRAAGESEFRVRAAATWHPSQRYALRPVEAFKEHASFGDGPLEWRANAGVAWTRGETTLGINAQYFGRYKVTYGYNNEEYGSRLIRYNGGPYVPAQLYFDVVARRRLQLGPAAVEASLGIINLLDKSPPIHADPDRPGYSYYGDPRRRRFELVLSSSF